MENNEENKFLHQLKFGDNWRPEWIDHFKQQLLFFEVSGPHAQVLYNGGGWQTRHEIMIKSIKEAVERKPVSYKKRFYLFTGDQLPQNLESEWRILSTVGGRSDFDSIVPDAYSFSWPEIGVTNFSDHNDAMFKKSQELLAQNRVLNKAYWRGSLNQNPSRREFFNQVKGNEHFDVLDVSMTNFKSMQDVGEYSVLIDLPGQGYSARLKHLVLSGRPVIVYPRDQWDWVSVQLEPGIHYLLSMPSCDHLKISCELALFNSAIRNFYSNKGQEARILLKRETLYSAISNRINSCD